jgi:glycosyltransferase involved in cell wall biosynthesis
MKLLQVNNLASICGGTTQCSLSITKSLQDFDHAVHFFSGRNGAAIQGAFEGVERSFGSNLSHETLAKIAPDVVIFHNTGEVRMPTFLPGDPVTVYYQHSAALACRSPRRRCDIALGVSKHLCHQSGLGSEWMLYQPIHMDGKREIRDRLTIGRLCTPVPNKWNAERCGKLYRLLSRRHPEVKWEFVGCPDHVREVIIDAVKGFDCEFFPASPAARGKLYEWDAMLYDSEIEESYGRTVCEAQMAGCIPIVTRRGGFIEQINHGADGFLCRDDAEFVWAVKQLYDTDTLSEVSECATLAGNSRGSLPLWRKSFLMWLEAILEENATISGPKFA